MKTLNNLPKIVVTLTGFKESGKTTVYKILEELGHDIGLNSKEYMMAEHLKETCSDVFEIPFFKFESQDHKEVPFEEPVILREENITRILDAFEMLTIENVKICKRHLGVSLETPRKILQYIGTDVLRDLDQMVHVKATLRSVEGVDMAIFPDCRFKNEVASVREKFWPMGVTVINWFVDEEGAFNKSLKEKEAGTLHASELEMFEIREELKSIVNLKDGIENLKKVVRENFNRELIKNKNAYDNEIENLES